MSKEISKLIEESLQTAKPDEIRALISIDFSTRIIYHITTMRLDTLKGLGDRIYAQKTSSFLV